MLQLEFQATSQGDDNVRRVRACSWEGENPDRALDPVYTLPSILSLRVPPTPHLLPPLFTVVVLIVWHRVVGRHGAPPDAQ